MFKCLLDLDGKVGLVGWLVGELSAEFRDDKYWDSENVNAGPQSMHGILETFPA